MPPAGRAAALAIFNLSLPKERSTSRTRNDTGLHPPKWEEVFADAALTSPQSKRASKRLRYESEGSQNKAVATKTERLKKKKKGIALAVSTPYVKQEKGGLKVSQDNGHVKVEDRDDAELMDLHEEVTDEQVSDALAQLKNSLAKTKISSAIPDRILYSRLKTVGFDLYPVEDGVNTYFPFTRLFLSQWFGGSPVDTFPKPSAEMLEKRGVEDLAFLSLMYNPHAPQVPGAPGLFYVCSDAQGQLKTRRTFVRLNNSKTQQWTYAGRYTYLAAPSLTAHEYNLLSRKVKDTWCKKITTALWAREVRARIYLRSIKGGMEPSKEEVEKLLSENPDILKTITEDQVTAAYQAGEERLGVWTMKCIDYSAEWIAGLITQDYPVWEKEYLAKQDERRGTTHSKHKTQKGKGAAKRRTLKRKATPIDTPSDDDGGESELTDYDYESST